MSNLGGYQTITTIIKALGGPKKAGGIIIGGAVAVGTVVGSFLPSPVTSVKNAIKKRAEPNTTTDRIFTVHTNHDGDGRREPTLRAGNQYRVFETDGDAILIEVLGDPESPYFVSGVVLEKISDFTTGKPEKDK